MQRHGRATFPSVTSSSGSRALHRPASRPPTGTVNERQCGSNGHLALPPDSRGGSRAAPKPARQREVRTAPHFPALRAASAAMPYRYVGRGGRGSPRAPWNLARSGGAAAPVLSRALTASSPMATNRLPSLSGTPRPGTAAQALMRDAVGGRCRAPAPVPWHPPPATCAVARRTVTP